jgi:glutamate synthase domain-containing protein 2
MAEKVVDEITKVRGIPEGTDLISPARHMDIVGPEDLKMKIQQLREITDWKVPIMVKYAPGRIREDVKIAAKAGADVIVVDGMQAGTGASPEVVLEHAGLPTLAAVVIANGALEEVGLRDEVDLVISGGITSGADVAKALALGADAVSISTAALVALGCRVCGLCNTGRCPYGIATHDPELRKRLNVDEGARKVANLLRAFTDEASMLAMLAGKTSLSNLEKEDLRALTVDASKIAGVRLVGVEDLKT